MTRSRAGHGRRYRISGQFAWRLIEMLLSPAWRVLNLSERRALDRIEIELAAHAGDPDHVDPDL